MNDGKSSQWDPYILLCFSLFSVGILQQGKVKEHNESNQHQIMITKKTIKWYAVKQYGNIREFIHPDHSADAAIIAQLTGQKTINSAVRELIRDLTGCQIDFEQVIDPATATR